MEEFSIDGKTQRTTAQILLKWLDDHPELDYVAYYGSYEEAKNLKHFVCLRGVFGVHLGEIVNGKEL
jgi:hypothetical protein